MKRIAFSFKFKKMLFLQEISPYIVLNRWIFVLQYDIFFSGKN